MTMLANSSAASYCRSGMIDHRRAAPDVHLVAGLQRHVATMPYLWWTVLCVMMQRLSFAGGALAGGVVDRHALHVCVDMQRLFLEPGSWHVPAGLEILPNIERLCAHAGRQNVFTKFITAKNVDEMEGHGQWQDYYQRWENLTQDKIGAEVLDIHPKLVPFTSDDREFDKRTYSAFSSPRFSQWIKERNPSALIFTGVETDACVLATVLSAVDRGYRCVIATDAVASSSVDAHTACLHHVYTRFATQIELATVDSIIAEWNNSVVTESPSMG